MFLTASGPTKDILSSPDSALVRRYLQAYTKYSNVILSGKLPVVFQPFFSSARLIALNKADNGIRPIAVGNVDSHTISKLGCTFVIKDAQRYFSPLQIGVRVPGGANAAVHAINRIIEQDKQDAGKSILTRFCQGTCCSWRSQNRYQLWFHSHRPITLPRHICSSET